MGSPAFAALHEGLDTPRHALCRGGVQVRELVVGLSPGQFGPILPFLPFWTASRVVPSSSFYCESAEMSLSLLGIGMPGLPEMLVILFVVLLLFGGAKLPSLMRNMGRSANEFKRGMKDADDEGDAEPHEPHEKHEA